MPQYNLYPIKFTGLGFPCEEYAEFLNNLLIGEDGGLYPTPGIGTDVAGVAQAAIGFLTFSKNCAIIKVGTSWYTSTDNSANCNSNFLFKYTYGGIDYICAAGSGTPGNYICSVNSTTGLITELSTTGTCIGEWQGEAVRSSGSSLFHGLTYIATDELALPNLQNILSFVNYGGELIIFCADGSRYKLQGNWVSYVLTQIESTAPIMPMSAVSSPYGVIYATASGVWLYNGYDTELTSCYGAYPSKPVFTNTWRGVFSKNLNCYIFEKGSLSELGGWVINCRFVYDFYKKYWRQETYPGYTDIDTAGNVRVYSNVTDLTGWIRTYSPATTKNTKHAITFLWRAGDLFLGDSSMKKFIRRIYYDAGVGFNPLLTPGVTFSYSGNGTINPIGYTAGKTNYHESTYYSETDFGLTLNSTFGRLGFEWTVPANTSFSSALFWLRNVVAEYEPEGRVGD